MIKTPVESKGRFSNRRARTIAVVILSVAVLAIVTVAGMTMDPGKYGTNFADKNMAPCAAHLFGTDWMGRDMFFRTVKGLSMSIYIGLIASFVSSVLALFLGIIAGTMGKIVSGFFNWFVDLFMGVPHLVLLILISVLTGKGARGVMIGVIVTHWCSLGRIVQAEVFSLRQTQYVQASEKLGKSRWFIACRHMVPHVLPQELHQFFHAAFLL